MDGKDFHVLLETERDLLALAHGDKPLRDVACATPLETGESGKSSPG